MGEDRDKIGGGVSHPVAALRQGAPGQMTAGRSTALPTALLCFGNSVNRK